MSHNGHLVVRILSSSYRKVPTRRSSNIAPRMYVTMGACNIRELLFIIATKASVKISGTHWKCIKNFRATISIRTAIVYLSLIHI